MQKEHMALVVSPAIDEKEVEAVDVSVPPHKSCTKLLCVDGLATSCRVLEHAGNEGVGDHVSRIFLLVNGPATNRAAAFAVVSHSNCTLFRVFASIFGTK